MYNICFPDTQVMLKSSPLIGSPIWLVSAPQWLAAVTSFMRIFAEFPYAIQINIYTHPATLVFLQKLHNLSINVRI